MATPPGAVLVPRAGTGGDDELDYLASCTLHKRRDFLEQDAEARTAPNREFYFRKNADLDALIQACGRKLAQGCRDSARLRALMIRGKAYLKKGARVGRRPRLPCCLP